MQAEMSKNKTKLFYKEAHINFVRTLDKKNDTFEYWAMEHLKLSGMYWGLTSLALMNALPAKGSKDEEEVIAFVMSCGDEKKQRFGGNAGHDPHLLYTLSAIQILALFDRLEMLDVGLVAKGIAEMQQADGSFWGDEWGEVDTRFSFIAIMGLSLLGKLDVIDCDKAVEFILKCKNFDEAFGAVPDAESHAGQTFCCVGALAIVGALDRIDRDKLSWWLCERQLPCGGLNGRPEKKEDVCYSWWVLSALSILGRLNWIDGDALTGFILDCQDAEDGGISDRPENHADVFHLFFGICGLSLLESDVNEKLEAVDPAYALPVQLLKQMKIALPWVKPKE